MPERNFAIVHFDTDNSVEVVPKQWINDDETSSYFPDNIKGKKLSKAVKNSINPEPSWPNHLCTVMRYYETYDDAKMYLNDAMYTSDLSACEKGRPRQKKKQNKSTVLPVHPSNSSYNRTSVQPLTVSMGSQEEPGPSFVLLSDTPCQDDGSHSVILPAHSPVVATCDCDEFRRDVLLQLQALKDSSQQQTELLNCILEQVRINPQRPTTISEPEVEYSFVPNQFPMKDLDSLDDVMQIITENKKAYEELVRRMALCGGGTMEEAMKLIFKMLFSDDVLAAHCFKGQSKKRAFIGYAAILDAVVDSLRRNGRVMLRQDVTQNAVHSVIPKLLKHAADRLFSRAKVGAKLQIQNDQSVLSTHLDGTQHRNNFVVYLSFYLIDI